MKIYISNNIYIIHEQPLHTITAENWCKYGILPAEDHKNPAKTHTPPTKEGSVLKNIINNYIEKPYQRPTGTDLSKNM